MNLRTLALAITLIAGAPPGPAAGQGGTTRSTPDSIAAGAWALQFRITGNFSLSDFQGAALSGKYHATSTSAIRLGFSASGGVSDREQTSFSESSGRLLDDPAPGQESEETRESNRDETAYSLGLDGQYVTYINPDGRVKLFGGIGPTIRYQHDDANDSDFQLDESGDRLDVRITETTTRDDRDTWTFGGLALLGGEWFASPHISLSAEYGLSVEYFRTSHDQTVELNRNIESEFGTSVFTDTRVAGTHRDGWQFRSPPVRFGLNVYF